MKLTDMTILIDSKETTPFEFPGRRTVTRNLVTGDYSLLGFEERGISIERKAVGDFLSSMTSGRDRFMKEMERLSKFHRKYLVVECNFAFLWKGEYGFTRTHPNSVIGTLCKIAVQYEVFPIFAGGHRDGGVICDRLLEQYFLKFREGKI